MSAEPSHCSQARLVVLTNIQWMYGPTWGNTLVICGGSGGKQKAPCLQWEQVHARQVELTEVLRRNALHPLVAAVHVLVGETEPVREYLQQLQWYRKLPSCKRVELVPVRGRPTFASYISHASTHLRGKVVVLVNQDIFLSHGWEQLPTMLAPGEAYVLSRHHEPVAYLAKPGLKALSQMNLTQFGSDPAWARRVRYESPRMLQLETGVRGSAAKVATTCLMGRAFEQSTCVANNYGAYDAYVFVLRQQLSAQQVAIFDFPQNAWGGENIVLYLLRHGLGLQVRNPCQTLRVVHVHCQMRSVNAQGANTRVVGDERQTRKRIAIGAMQRLAALGVSVTMPNVLNANESCLPPRAYHCHRRKCPCLAPGPSFLSPERGAAAR